MKFSARTAYALRAMLEMARRHSQEQFVVTLNELAESCDIPGKFLVAVLSDLRGAGLLESIRGKAGGYRLASHPSAISVGDVVRATEPPAAPSPGSSTLPPFHSAGAGLVERLRKKSEAAAFAVLDDTSIADAAAKASSDKSEMYYI